ncbi:hypothetical protein, partial [Halarchaeum salinum]|uniref:hypothetical protein n=1 Tax=Halarchaeum salinum TaxID=489912 RepID=UPI0031E42888
NGYAETLNRVSSPLTATKLERMVGLVSPDAHVENLEVGTELTGSGAERLVAVNGDGLVFTGCVGGADVEGDATIRL